MPLPPPGSELHNNNRNSKLGADIGTLDKLVTSLLAQHQNGNSVQQRQNSMKMNRLRPLSRSLSRIGSFGRRTVRHSNGNQYQDIQSQSVPMPTIPEGKSSMRAKDVLKTFAPVPNRFSKTDNGDEEHKNILDDK